MPDFKIVGKNLRKIMADRKMTIDEMAAKTGVHKNCLYGYISFMHYPTSKQMQIMADGLGIKVTDLFMEV